MSVIHLNNRFEIIKEHSGRLLNRYPIFILQGRSFRKWYGNNEYVVNWENNGLAMKALAVEKYNSVTRTITNIKYFFREGLTWSSLTSGNISLRYFPQGFIFDSKGSSMFFSGDNDSDIYYILSLINSKVSKTLLDILAPTVDFNIGPMAKIPVIVKNEYVDILVSLTKKAIEISKSDWDFNEYSWDFCKHPLTRGYNTLKVEYQEWENMKLQQFTQMKLIEEEINRIFIHIYELDDELNYELNEKEITINKPNLEKDIKSLLSYIIGCMFGRYSLDFEGLAYAGGEWNISKYSKYMPDNDNVVLISEDEYFSDDIITRIVDFVKTVYGTDNLEENLDFIADVLGNKGNTSREAIRNYFLKDFYKDHVKTYQKRPIYWMFDSGKENGFKALIYIHRYDEDTVGRVRADYLHKQQGFLENAIAQCDVILESNASPTDKAKAVKQREKLVKQFAETKLYDQAMAHIAHKRIPIDLDDGVKVNYAKFQGIEVASEGKKTVKVDLLAKI